jgi:hypothetical protein
MGVVGRRVERSVQCWISWAGVWWLLVKQWLCLQCKRKHASTALEYSAVTVSLGIHSDECAASSSVRGGTKSVWGIPARNLCAGSCITNYITNHLRHCKAHQ